MLQNFYTQDLEKSFLQLAYTQCGGEDRFYNGLTSCSLKLQEHKPLGLGAAGAHFPLVKENMTN